MNVIADFPLCRFRPASLLRIVLAAVSFSVAGCATQRTITLDSQNPSLRVSTQGVLFEERYVEPMEAAEILLDYGIPKTRTIHILLDADVKNLSQARSLMGCLAKAGYTRPVLVTKRHAESHAVGSRGRSAAAPVKREKRNR